MEFCLVCYGFLGISLVSTMLRKWMEIAMIRLKKILSQSLWQIGKPMRHVFLSFYLSFFLSFLTFVQCEIWNLDFWWVRYKTNKNQSTEFKKLYLLICIFDKKIKRKKKKRKIKRKKNQKAWILLSQARIEKQMRATALRQILFCLASYKDRLQIAKPTISTIWHTALSCFKFAGFRLRNKL